MDEYAAPELAEVEDSVRAHWEAVLADLDATAEEYDERGWETLAVRPGDVTALAGEDVERPGFDVLLPDDEFADLLDVVEGGSFDDYEVYSTVQEGVVFLVIVVRDEDRETAVLVPAYYGSDEEDVGRLRERAAETGTVKTHLRRLQEDRIVTFEHDDPDLFFPETDEGE